MSYDIPMDNLIFISNLFPNPLEPNKASFNRQQLLALSSYFNIDVVSPLPWYWKLKYLWVSNHYKIGPLSVWHPTYMYSPGILRGFYGDFFYYSIRFRVRALAEQTKIQGIIASWLYPDGWAGARLARELGLPLFIKVHGSDVNLLKPGSGLCRKALWAVAQAEKVFCVSQALKDRLIELGAAPEKLQVHYNGVDKNVFYPLQREVARRELGVTESRKIILYVGNLKKEKGLGELAQAFCRIKAYTNLNSCRLVVVGTGPFVKCMKGIMRTEHVLDDAIFLGSQPLEQVALWMNAADVVCLPSYMEGIPNVILEAIACRTPVVSTCVGGIPEIAIEGDGVRLVEPQNVAELEKSLRDVMELKARPNFGFSSVSWAENAAKIAGVI